MKGRIRLRRIARVAAPLAFLIAGSITHPARAATFTVINADDSGPGSFRQAIADANATPGADTITFNITGPSSIKPLTALPTITDPVVIDGSTQPGFSGSPVIELDGSLAVVGIVSGLTVEAGSTTVRALVINRWSGDGILLQVSGGNRIEGNYIGTDVSGTLSRPNLVAIRIKDFTGPANLIGGTSPAARNLVSGNVNGIIAQGPNAGPNVIQGNFIGTDVTGTQRLGNDGNAGIALDRAPNNLIGGTVSGARNIISGQDLGIQISSSGNLVQGNYIGTDVTGAQAIGATSGFSGGVAINQNGTFPATNNLIGGTTPSARNVISGNTTGVVIGADGNRVEGNYIGTDFTGTQNLGQSDAGVVLIGSNNSVGGTSAGARNVISANRGYGIQTAFDAAGNMIQGNYIGTNASGTGALGNGIAGLILNSVGNTTVGGTAPGAANVIAFNGNNGGFGGVVVFAGTGNAILTNSIHSNTGLGIDLFPLGVTPNDPGDADSGPNELQNFPVLTSASTGGGTTQIQGTLNSHAITAYRLEFFSNTTCDPSGYGEGERFLGSTNVATNATGSVSFNATFAGMSSFVTATATDPAGNTSEFSNCAPVAVVTPPKECHKGDGDGDVDREDRGKHHKAHAHMHKDDCDDRDKGEVDEDDEDAGEHFQSTEVSSSGFSFDNGTRTLTMSGTGLSNGLPVGFTVIAVDNGFLPGTVTLVLTDGYRISGPLVSGTIAIR